MISSFLSRFLVPTRRTLGYALAVACCSGVLFPPYVRAAVPDNIFGDASLTTLAPGVKPADIESIADPALRRHARSLQDGTFDRINRSGTYTAYETIPTLSKRIKTSGYNRFENPTGIYFDKGDKAALYVSGIGDDKPVLRIHDFRTEKGKDYPLKNGLNEIDVELGGLAYVSYYTDRYLQAPPVNVTILNGKVNGVFRAGVHNNDEWKRMLDNAACDVIDIRGRWVHLVFPVKELREACPGKGVELIALYDDIINHQHDLMGFVKYRNRPKNSMFGRAVWRSFMFADGLGAGFNANTLKTIANPDKIPANSWGIAHEFGHVNQTRPGMMWIITTEVTNNIFAAWSNYLLDPGNLRLEHENTVDAEGRRQPGGRFNCYLDSALIQQRPWSIHYGSGKNREQYDQAGEPFVRLCTFWQLQLYFGAARMGNPDLYADIFETVRNTDQSGKTNGELALAFVKNACDAAKQDLSGFFIQTGMLRPIDRTLKGYSSGRMTITQDDCDNMVRYASRYPKPASPVIFYISGNSVEAYKHRKPVVGSYNQGITDGVNGKTVSHNVWKNVVAFETYQGRKLVKVAMAGTGTKDNSSTNVVYPEGATRIEAVSWDGKRRLVYGKR